MRRSISKPQKQSATTTNGTMTEIYPNDEVVRIQEREEKKEEPKKNNNL